MLNFAKNIRGMSITQTMVLVAAVPLAFTLCMSIFLTFPKLQQVRDYGKSLKVAELTTILSALVHEQQKERGATAVFLSTSGQSFGDKLIAQRAVTDAKRAIAENAINDHLRESGDSDFLLALNEKLRNILAQLAEMPTIREQVDAMSLSPPQAISYYTNLNNMALSIVSDSSLATNDASIAIALKAFSSFLKGKERAGIERAIGSSGFGVGKFTMPRLLKLQNLISIQSTYFDSFLSEAAPADVKDFQTLMESEAVREVDRMREVAFDSVAFQNLQGISGGDFFAAMTEKINLLKAFEDQLAERMIVNMQVERANANFAAMVSIASSLLAVALGAMSVWLVSSPIRDYMRAVSRSATTMAEGNLSVKIPEATASELGDIVAALDHFRNATLSAREKDAAFREKEKREQQLQLERKKQEQDAEKQQTRQREAEFEATRQREHAIALEISEVVSACARGDFSKRLSLKDKEGIFESICSGINDIAETTDMALNEISNALSALADGDLMSKVPTNYDGIFGEIVLTLNHMLDKLGNIVTSIREGTDVVGKFSEDLTSSADSLSKRTIRNSAALEETSAALSQIEKSVISASQNARGARTSTASVVEESNNGIATVDQAVKAMQEIKESSDSISKIIDLMNGIAFQTNLLALNAGIEAARAGESGRGFAVVASEVRALAARSLEAASEISDVISDTGQKVDEGVRLVNLSGDALKSITSSILTVAKNIDSVAEGADDQVAGIKHIAQSTDELDRSTQDNAAMFEENSRVIGQMKKVTEDLMREVAFFKVHALAASASSDEPVARLAMRA